MLESAGKRARCDRELARQRESTILIGEARLWRGNGDIFRTFKLSASGPSIARSIGCASTC